MVVRRVVGGTTLRIEAASTTSGGVRGYDWYEKDDDKGTAYYKENWSNVQESKSDKKEWPKATPDTRRVLEGNMSRTKGHKKEECGHDEKTQHDEANWTCDRDSRVFEKAWRPQEDTKHYEEDWTYDHESTIFEKARRPQDGTKHNEENWT